jgi:hypothetical protein
MMSRLCFVLALVDSIAVSSVGTNEHERYAAGKGFHLDLVTQVSFAKREDYSKCELMLIESFPSGAFVDVDQLSELQRFGGLGVAQIHVLDPFIDVEKPSERSAPFEFQVEFPAGSMMFPHRRVAIPIHLRYHSPNPKGHAIVKIPPPVLCSNCALSGMEESVASRSGRCKEQLGRGFTTFKALKGPLSETLELSVPVGDPDDLQVITLATVAVVFLGTLKIIHSSLASSGVNLGRGRAVQHDD